MKTIDRFLIRTAISLVALVSVPILSHSQTQDFSSPFSDLRPSADVASVSSYGGLTPSLYTGAMTFSVPLFTYSDYDFTIPASLEYHYDGYRPSSCSGEAGLGWALSLGGSVTREVRGVPDEAYSSDGINGYMESVRLGIPFDTSYSIRNARYDFSGSGARDIDSDLFCDLESIQGLINPFSDTPVMYNSAGWRYETTPDLFHFSVDGMEGDFMLLPDGSVSVFNCNTPHGEVRVTIDDSGSTPHASLTIALISGDGTEYLFGGSSEATEYSEYACDDESFYLGSVPDDALTAVAFRLVSITKPNGRCAQFTYSQQSQSQVTGCSLRLSRVTAASGQCTGGSVSGSFGSLGTAFHSGQMQHYPLLESVAVDGDCIISLTYSQKTQDECATSWFDHPDIFNYFTAGFSTDPPKRLSRIELWNHDGQVVDCAVLTHHYASQGTPKMFLDSVTSLRSGRHSFSYESHDGLPKNDTECTDWWGWWNNNGMVWSDLRLTGGSLYDQFVSASIKSPSFDRALSGALSIITFPTGGTCSISYEQNSVSRRISYSLDQTPQLVASPSSFEVGGIRVRSITENDGSSARTTSFTYESADGQSSGMLLQMPLLALPISFRYASQWCQMDVSMISYASGSRSDMPRGGTVAYDCVRRRMPDGSATETCFHSYDDYPDEFWTSSGWQFMLKEVSGPQDWYSPDSGSAGSLSGARAYGVCAPVVRDLSCMRGRTSSERTYSSDGRLRIEKSYTYELSEVAETGVTWHNNIFNFVGTSHPLCQTNLVSVGMTEHLDDGTSTSEQTDFRYNSLGQMYCTVTSNSSGDTAKEYRKYLHQTNSSALKSLTSDAVTTKMADGQEWLVALERYSYSNPTRNARPSSVTEYGVSGSMLSASDVFRIPSGSQSRTTTITYDSQYRPTNIIRPGGAYTSYSWSGRNPVSRTDNASSNTTGYFWKDLVGLTAVSYPSGRSEAYSYDSGNRLEYIRNSSNNPVTRYRWYIGSGAYVDKITHTSSGGRSSFSDKTWYDGLGHPVQETAVSASPGGKSIITPIVYDSMRRADAVAYLPYAASSGTSSFVQTASAISAQASFYRSTYGDSHAYALNEYEPWAGGMLIGSRRPGDAWADGGHDSSYSRRTNSSSDAVRRITQTPGSNSTVTTSGYHSSGSLVADVLTDEEGDESVVFTDAYGKKICTRRSDGSTCADTYYVYDIRDSLVCVIQPEGAASLPSSATVSFTSDIARKWFFTWKYDAWGNVTEYHVPGGGTTTYTYDGRDRLINEKTPKLSELGATRVMTYDDCDRPVSEEYRRDADGRAILTHSWTYNPFGSSAPSGSRGLLQSETVWEIPQGVSVNQNSLAFCTRTYSYDSEGRVTGIIESWSDGWTSEVATTYDFIGNVLSVSETHTSPAGLSGTISTAYTYDHRGRRLTCSRSVSGDDTGDMPLATVAYSYDELGRPSGKTVTGANGSTLVDEDIDLDIHGWTTGISARSGSGVDIFTETLRYASPPRGSSSARYDGLIGETSAQQAGGTVHTYGYGYDGMKRLAGAEHYEGASRTSVNASTEKALSYDRNGNVTALTRYDEGGSADVLSFTHDGNRMTSVNGCSFTYDSAGNMTRDGRKGLDISYNCLNLPSYAGTADGSSLTYTYLADGTKVSAVSGEGWGLRYRGSFVYSSGDWGDDSLESIAWDEGRIAVVAPPADTVVMDGPTPLNDTGAVDSVVVDSVAANLLRDMFFVKDHLGNVRTVLDISPDLTEAQILEQNDYLPFGNRVENVGYASMSGNRHRYAAKEEQRMGGTDLSLIDFGARYYDPHLARWTSVDPMAQKYLGMSPYGYCANSPLSVIDDGGMDLILLGANNTSVTFKTDLVNMSVNVGRLGIDWNGNHTLDGDRYLSAALDIAGVFDPSGIADIANAGLQYRGGDKLGAAISAAGIAPYVGDLAKATRIGKDLRLIGEAINLPPYTRGNFRKNLLRMTGEDGVGKQAHHIFPVKFKDKFNDVGINIHDPKYGCWLDSYNHNKGSYQYNREWEDFFRNYPVYTQEQIMNTAKEIMMKVYGE